MATPTSSGIVSSVDLTGYNYIDSLLWGEKWSGSEGTGANLTYSFGGNSSRYSKTYSNFLNKPSNDFGSLTNTQKNAANKALNAWSEVANLNFTEVFDSSTVAGDLRFARSSVPIGASTFFPSATTEAGDIWFSYDSEYNTPIEGTFGYATFLHEIGHALGLKHPHEQGSGVSANLDIDTIKYTVMSYRAYVGQPIDEDFEQVFYSTTPMLNDIAAIQYLYGANTKTRSGNTNYSWSPGEQILETIWDAGGVDTIDWSNQSTAAAIDLNAGEWSELGPSYWNGRVNDKETLAIAYNVTIENAKGSSADDRIIGNSARNNLQGKAGNDYLNGGAESDILNGGKKGDTLIGGTGNDTLDGKQGNDVLYGGEEKDLLIGGSGDDNLKGGRGHDILTGNLGRDTLRGGKGNDILTGGKDVDLLFGNEGKDTFVIERVFSNNDRLIIKDYDDALDTLSLADDLSFSDLIIRDNSTNSGTVIKDKFTNDTLATLSGIDSTVIMSDDFVTV